MGKRTSQPGSVECGQVAEVISFPKPATANAPTDLPQQGAPARLLRFADGQRRKQVRAEALASGKREQRDMESLRVASAIAAASRSGALHGLIVVLEGDRGGFHLLMSGSLKADPVRARKAAADVLSRLV